MYIHICIHMYVHNIPIIKGSWTQCIQPTPAKQNHLEIYIRMHIIYAMRNFTHSYSIHCYHRINKLYTMSIYNIPLKKLIKHGRRYFDNSPIPTDRYKLVLLPRIARTILQNGVISFLFRYETVQTCG